MNESTRDAIRHIGMVQCYLNELIKEWITRSSVHDLSKLNEPELSGYAGLSDAVKGLKYGTDEYRAAFAPFKAIINHHYEANDHHPEHFKNGLAGMNLLQLVEMVCDWKAASLRTSSTLEDSLEASFQRFKIEPQLAAIIYNTIRELRW